MHEDNAESGFAVLGFPCNQFGAQEPGTEAEIKQFVTSKFDVTFPMFAKIEVNGPGTAPLYEHLKAGAPGDIAWNFTKFLVGRDGSVLKRYEPRTTPEEIAAELTEFL